MTAILTEAQRDHVKAMRGVRSASALAAQYGVARATITKIWMVAKKKSDPKLGDLDYVPYGRISALTELRRQYPQRLTPEFVCDPADDPVTTAGKTFMDLSEQECAWWIGNDPEGAQRFCGCPVQRPPGRLTRRYCEAHAAYAVVGQKPPSPWPKDTRRFNAYTAPQRLYPPEITTPDATEMAA